MSLTHPNSDHPDNGITFRRGSYHARYYRDGAQCFSSLYTDDIAVARERRDEFYAETVMRPVKLKGRPRSSPPGMTGKLPHGATYRKPFHLKLEGRSHGYFHTINDLMSVYRRVSGDGNAEEMATAACASKKVHTASSPCSASSEPPNSYE